MNKLIILFGILFFTAACSNNADKTSSEEETASEQFEGSVSFANIADGDTLASPFLLEMGVDGMTLEPKGESKPGFGHHHLLINDDAIDEGIVIVADSTHIHYGGGQASDSVSLAPGDYTLTLQFGDGLHISYGEAWSASVNVIVK